MKNGKLFFYNMGTITTAARIGIPVSVLAAMQMRPFSPAFWFLIGLGVISLFVALVHAPSDKAMLQVLELHRKEMAQKMKDMCEIKDDQFYVVLDGYRKGGNEKLHRRIGAEVIYPHPTTFIFAQKGEKRRLLIVQKNLLTPTPAEYELLDLSDPQAAAKICVSSHVDPENDQVAEVTLVTERYPKGITLFAKNDYHYRDFVKAAEALPRNKETV